MKVLLINGSPRKDGDTAYSLGIVEKVLNGANIETEWFHLGTDKVRGCCDCNQCSATSRCAFSDDRCNELIEQIIEADGVIVGTPVYFAGANGALCALLDRVFYAASNYGHHFSGKPAAAVATCWRAGATATLDRLNKYFSYSGMPIVSSNYWNLKLNGEDRFGEKILKNTGRKYGQGAGASGKLQSFKLMRYSCTNNLFVSYCSVFNPLKKSSYEML